MNNNIALMTKYSQRGLHGLAYRYALAHNRECHPMKRLSGQFMEYMKRQAQKSKVKTV